MAIARVALDVPVPMTFDYRDGGLGLVSGALVVVPFGRRRQVGVVLELAQQPLVERARLRDVERVLPVEPLPAEALALIQFCSDYYHHPIGQVALSALPTALRRSAFAGVRGEVGYVLTPAAAGLEQRTPARASVMQALLAAMRGGAVLGAAEARRISPRAPGVLREWQEQGWVEERQGEVSSPPATMQPGPPLTDEQRAAVERIGAGFGSFAPVLLDGITGSGKTEVYFHLIAHALARTEQVLLMVPEINLTPQLEARFRSRFPGVRLAAMHSGLAEAGRCQRWLEARSGAAQVVIGTRLSVFTPMPRLGLVIVDEEHDASYKQQDGVRYSARDLAVFLAQQRRIPVVLGSATPSIESYHNARSGRFVHLHLRSRPAASRPDIRVVDVRDVPPQHGLSGAVVDALDARLRRGEQSLVFLNRRGYAPSLTCSACGWSAECSRCSARLVWHLREAALRCHYCGHEEAMPAACPACGNQDLRGLGQGTQRLEQTLAARFPGARVLRIDRDTTRRKHAWRAMREQIVGDGADILVGTQMLAKGHDFPKLTLVAIVNPDNALYSADFRAAERLFQQLMQVAGRAGRADRAGEVLLQTRFPAHPVYEALQRQDYSGFADALLAERKSAGFPPFVYQAVLRAESVSPSSVTTFLEAAARVGAGHADGVTLYDPVPAAVERVAGHFRAQLLVQAPGRAALQRFLRAWLPLLAEGKPARVRWAIDVDPLDL
jgi:primosomal protein N' (replication factor Y)